ncbi:RNA polymerase sigma factor (sigma-70 family) [Catenuloplanes nepalensis]|uniref:RNA polymerase sigma factor (Sigma-70 family) n=1 Tax=Catenuloplanes nepalensis TaxID=587533 RepID=A0ABT9MZ93_9ACTN|nr:RNA polymerase sigma factor [Catenuloplanes nepalensis]MDP9796764.1 RNA polymerase sigma factor (sigma-70 family) [Catenuloplanes nepalensis]
MDVQRRIEAIWRIESARLIASLSRLTRDVGTAEEIAQDVFVAALSQWPAGGVPPNPGAWLHTTGRHKAIDRIRRDRMRDDRQIGAALDPTLAADRSDDDLLALIFTACHPVLPRESRTALTLRLLGGLSTDEIARAFLVPSPTIGQRISRAKRTLTEAKVPFETPTNLGERLPAVLEVVYLIFTEGYAATSGDAWIRRDLAEEAMRLGRMLTGLLPREPEPFGLVALMELQASRFRARTAPDGSPILLQDQDRSRWDRTLIQHGLAALDRATALRRPLGSYSVQAAIAAVHTRAPAFADTDWEAIVALYDALGQIAPSPVVALNRAVAVLHADGPDAALTAIDEVRTDPRMARYHLVGAVRGDVLLRLGRPADAAEELERAAELAPTQRERNLLLARAAAATAL